MIKLVFLAIFSGILGGYFFCSPADKEGLDLVLMSALSIMVFIAGIEIGSNRHLLAKICTPRSIMLALALPLGVIAGSLGGAWLAAPLLGLARQDAVLVAGGLGWYSLSSVVISTMYSTEIGTVAFLTNMLRETGAILIMPVLARWNKLVTIAPAGAATMDSGLPIVIQNTNLHIGMFGFISGLILTLIVPALLSYLMP